MPVAYDRLGGAFDGLCPLRMKAGNPKSIMALGGKFAYPNDASETPDTLQTVYEYDGFSILWEHATGIDGGNYGRNHGIAFIGNNGTLVVDREGWEIIPEREFAGWGKLGAPKMEAVDHGKGGANGLDLHTKNFISAIKDRTPSILKAPITVGHNAAKISHMGNIAFKTGQRIYWDDNTNTFTNSEATALMKVEYENGYRLPSL